MRTLFVLMLILTPRLAAETIKFPAGRFDKPPGKHGRKISPKGIDAKGKVTRYALAKPHLRALRLPRGRLRATVTIPTPRKPKNAAVDQWYGIVSIDVFGHRSDGPARVSLMVSEPNAKKPIAETSLRVDWRAPTRGAAAARVERLRLHVPAERFASAKERQFVVELRVETGAAVIDDLRVERFHPKPTTKLRGKSNGKLGPDRLGCGALGFDALIEHHATAFSIYAVRKDGPAAPAGLAVGDLVVAVDGALLPGNTVAPGWRWFETSHEAIVGRAIERAISEQRASLQLTILRGAEPRELSIRVPQSKPFASTFPFDDPVAVRLRTDITGWITKHQKKNGAWPGTHAVNPALGVIALLGTRDAKHRAAIERTIAFLKKKNPSPSKMTGLAYWALAFQGIAFAEYYFATGDRSMIPWMREAADWLPTTTHETKWGMQAFGHGPNGIPYGRKSLMAPTAHLLVFDALARKCNVDSRLWEHVLPYILHSWSDPEKKGHGGMGYNGSYKDKGEFWSRSGLTALALALRGERATMRTALTGIMQRRHPWMLNSHAYGEPGAALGLLSLATAAPETFREIMPKWRWRFRLHWQPGFGLRYSTPHMGSPYMGEEAIVNLAYGVLFAVMNRGLVIAGGEPQRWLRPKPE